MNLNAEDEKIMRSAQIGYEAYSEHTGGKSAVTGDKLPLWGQLPGAVTSAWFAAAKAMCEYAKQAERG